ncbi:hypothetical protein K470DRAFT_242619 [Piedraia hortae CBS 480.64]|uniref:Uncharacterized protein n=1 Tax=Piedraia hortae CBS 480.64 TaxID=1314780 RepID=A0A6A7C7S3_9PEZI|nr:hypothetical protein K470DRAFT_242619 [Piedraia hortae CBS 480.64]
MASSNVLETHVAIYLPSDSRDPHHWALFPQGHGKDVIWQIVDDGDRYTIDTPLHNKHPQRSSRVKELVLVGTVPLKYHDAALETIQKTTPNNTSKTWNCQSWVVEVLDNLASRGILTWKKGARNDLLGLRENWQ